MDKKIYMGSSYDIEAAHLVIIEEPFKNSIKCRCRICGAVDNYKLSDLKSSLVTACKTCRQGLSIGDTFDTMEVKKFTVNNNKFKVYMHCTKCNKIFIHSISQIKSKGYCCPICGNQGESSNTKIEKPKKNIREDKNIKEKNKKNILGNIASFENKPELDLTKFKRVGDFIFTGKTMSRSKTGSSLTDKIKGQCIHCGGTTTDTEKNFEKSEYKCKKCNIINSDKRNIIYNTNWVGYVRHNIEIVKTKKNSDGILMADTRCLACGHEMTIPVVTVVNEPELTCLKCGDTPVKMICPICRKPHIPTTMRKMYEQREDKMGFICKETNETVYASEIIAQHEILNRFDNIRKKYKGKGFNLLERISGHDNTPDIYKFEENYIGTDGLTYHTCMCGTHNKMMVLTDDEIRNYRHEYCADTRMMPYKPNKENKK